MSIRAEIVFLRPTPARVKDNALILMEFSKYYFDSFEMNQMT